MALPAKQQLGYWSLSTVAFLAVMWVLGDVLLPFIIAGAIAYCLDPVADRLQKWGLGRTASVALITVFLMLLFVFMALAVAPALIRQTMGLIETAPELALQFRDFLNNNFPGGLGAGAPLSEALASVADTVKHRGLELMTGLLGSALSLVNVLALLVIVPVVSVYLLVDWDRMIAVVDGLVPRDHVPTVRRLARDMDRTLSSFIRGQGLVCLIQGTFYAVALMLAGLNFGLVIGLIAGLLSFIPLVGSVVGGVLAIGLAIFQFWGDWFQIAVIAGIFFFGQIVEGNFLTPKLVGSSVGLHPVWLLLALSIFGSLFGFVGLLVAVPVAAIIGVLVRFLVVEYKGGRLYVGLAGMPDDSDADGNQDAAAE